MGIKVAASSAVSAINFGFDFGFCKVEASVCARYKMTSI